MNAVAEMTLGQASRPSAERFLAAAMAWRKVSVDYRTSERGRGFARGMMRQSALAWRLASSRLGRVEGSK